MAGTGGRTRAGPGTGVRVGSVSISSPAGTPTLGQPEARLDTSTLRWRDEPQDVASFAKTQPLPQVVKLDSGDYGNFGTGTHVDVQSPFLLYSGRRCNKVLASSVYWDDSKQDYVSVGPRVVIPVNYPGWFHFLQEFGQVGRPWSDIEQVADAQPETFVTRSTVPCFRFLQTSLAGERLYSKEEVTAGEVLTIGDVFSETVTHTRPACCFHWLLGKRFTRKTEEIKYLQCTDTKGRDVLLDFNLKGDFSPVGDLEEPQKDDVFRLGDVIKGSGFPIMVKLAFGQPPSTPCSFTGMLRLEEVYFEETLIACSLGTTRPLMVEFPTDSDIQFIVAFNLEQVKNSKLIKVAKEYCDEHIESYVGGIKVVQNFYPDHIEQETIPTNKERTLPPVPAETEQIPEDTESMEDGSTEYSDCSEFDDSEEEDQEDGDCESEKYVNKSKEYDEDSNYEVIPGDLIHNNNIEDDEGYLKPVAPTSNKESCQSVSPTSTKGKIAQIRRTFSRPGTGQDNLYVNGQSEFVQPVSRHSTFRSRQVIQDSPDPDLKDRMDAFLTDSVQELSRRQEVQRPTEPPPPPPGDPPPQPVLETNEEVDAFLENIFDCRRMTDDYMPVTARSTRRLASFSGADTGHRAYENCDRRSWNGSLKYRVPPLRFAFSNPEATLRRYNLKNIRPALKTFEFHDVPHFDGRSPPSNVDNRFYGFKTPTFGGAVSLNTFVPIQRPPSVSSPGSCVDPDDNASVSTFYKPGRLTPSPDREMYETRTIRTDSGIFVSPQWSDLGYDCDSPYRSTSEESWCPPEDLSPLSVAEVAQCLRYIGIKEILVGRFFDEQIDGKQLAELDENLLKEGFPELNALNRKKVLDFARGWRPKKL